MTDVDLLMNWFKNYAYVRAVKEITSEDKTSGFYVEEVQDHFPFDITAAIEILEREEKIYVDNAGRLIPESEKSMEEEAQAIFENCDHTDVSVSGKGFGQYVECWGCGAVSSLDWEFDAKNYNW